MRVRRLLKLLFVSLICLLPAACGTDTPEYIVIESESFVFQAQVKPETLKFYKTISFSSYQPREKQYLVGNAAELELFNQAVVIQCDAFTNAAEHELCLQAAQRERVVLDNLETYTYFIVRSVYCGEQEFIGSSYVDGTFTLGFNRYVNWNQACVAMYMDVYDVYRAEK